jgi:hypothetical protein
MAHGETSRPIGGFLGLELPAKDGGFRALWGASDPSRAYVNASSALAALVRAMPRGTVWLPAYICPELARAVPPDRLRYYPLDAELSPRADVLAASVRPGDILVAVDYFGRAPGTAFLDYVAAQPNVVFVEDSAQAIDTGTAAWGDWRLFSPRKVIGVPDGGLLVARSAKARAVILPDSMPDGIEAAECAAPQLARYEDEAETHNDVWFALNRAKEQAMPLSGRRVSRLTWALLGLLEPEPIADARRGNYDVLAARLADWAFLKDVRPPYVPLGFPVRLPPGARQRVQQHLYRQRVFPAVHWDNLPSPAAEFPNEHALSGALLTLPCDQRYGAAEMERVAALFLDVMR